MKQMVILSGKGGTGKTTLAGSFAALAENAVFVDADVDAADLHLLLNPTVKEEHEYTGGQEAVIDENLCTGCGACMELCRYDAISEASGVFTIDPYACEGCGVCARHCPAEAIDMQSALSGRWFVSDTQYGPFVHARLGIAADNSGKLVAVIREKARTLAEEQGRSLILIDGPPGIGCPVIASVTGADMVLAVTEPSVSGLHDLERIVELTRHFKIPTFVAVNKADLDETMSARIEAWCEERGVKVLGHIPFEKTPISAMVARTTLVEYSSGAAAMAVRDIWRKAGYELELAETPESREHVNDHE